QAHGSRLDRSCSSIPPTTTMRRHPSMGPAACSRRLENRRTYGSRHAAATSARSTRSRTSTTLACSRFFARRSVSSFRGAVRSERGDNLPDVPEVLELVLEHPSHYFSRRPPPSHHHVIERGVRGLHPGESLEDQAMHRLQSVVRIGRPRLEPRQKLDFHAHHVHAPFAHPPHRLRRLSLYLH